MEPSSPTETSASSPVEHAPTPTSLLLRETFGPTVQGEGRHVGRLAYFIRTGGCSLECKWCDEPKTWVFNERKRVKHKTGVAYNPLEVLYREEPWNLASAALEALPSHGCVVITGGEPVLQGKRVMALVSHLINRTGPRHCVEIETSGSVMPPAATLTNVVQWNVSPKLSHSGNSKEDRYKPNVLRAFNYLGADFKFVVDTPDDFEEVEQIVAAIHIAPDRVWIMPQGSSADAQISQMRKLADAIINRGFNLSPRLHVLIWDNEEKR